jgi:PAS domain S-box-containing protein
MDPRGSPAANDIRSLLYLPPSRRGWRAYAAAALSVALGIAARGALNPVIGPNEVPFVFCFPAVTAAAWYGGVFAGMFATILAAIAVNFFFMEPLQSFFIATPAERVAILAFIASSTMIVAAVQAMHRARASAVTIAAEHQRAQAARVEVQELLATTLASIGDAVIVTDDQGRITFLNAEAERLSGWTAEEGIGQPLMSVFRIVNEASREPIENPVDKVLRSGHAAALADHTVLLSKSGRTIPIEDSGAPVRRGDGPILGVVLVFRDATERRRAEKTAQDADRRKDEFLAILSHELRNPLAPIRIAVGMLRRLGPVDAKLQELRDIIDRQTQQLSRLLDDLLDVSRIGSGKILLRRDVISLGVAVSSAIETARPWLDAHDHELILDAPPEPMYVEGDLGRLAQVFSNLLSNAAKFTPKGGRIEVIVARDGDQARVHVRDNGIGIRPDKLTDIFEMFAQVGDPLERGQAGLGIGLSVAKTLIELHDGRIEAHSDGPGHGSELVVHLPMTSPPAAWTDATQGDAWEVPRDQRRRILVTDDNVDSVAVLASALSSAGHDVITAYDGPSALEQATAFRPQIAILDLGMPTMSGYEVARRLRSKYGTDIVLIALTGWGQEDDKRRAKDAGFDHHVTKPIDLTRLTDLLRPPAANDDATG